MDTKAPNLIQVIVTGYDGEAKADIVRKIGELLTQGKTYKFHMDSVKSTGVNVITVEL